MASSSDHSLRTRVHTPTYGPILERYQIVGWGKSRAPAAGARYDIPMRSRIPVFAALFVVGLFALPVVTHAAIPFFGPIIPEAYNQCAAGWGMLITVVN